jgi:ubiquinone/menaquinone biosynthesis C-methylase UbiE
MSTESISSWDPAWENVFRSQEWGKYPPEYVIRFVARNWYSASDRKKVRLFDLGCGGGACSWYMAREGFSVSGIDGSESAIDRATQRMESEGLHADLRVGDFTQLPWPDDSFDGVIDNVTLYCNPFENCRQTVAEVKRVLKPGGKFLSVNFTDRTWGYGLGEQVQSGTFTGIREGPFLGKGLALFMGRAQIDKLYRDFEEKDVELTSWTLDKQTHLVELWIVTCRKSL